MKISLGSDHAGFELKEAIKKHLIEKGHEVLDEGTYSADSVDYPIFAEKAAKDVTSGKAEYGILCCGSAEGISIAANKIPGIRAACCSDTFSARFTRMHNDANALCFGGRVVGAGLAVDMVDLFLDTEFEGGRHQKRI
ncbi:MAG: ribose 5-phosphate isomerase B, partial [Bacilli bacterium]|nr:ribose 5-phosphate isomerase B [Bacilli bacterium]